MMPKPSNPQRSRLRSFSDIFRRRKNQRRDRTSSTTLDESSAGENPSSPTSVKAGASSATENNDLNSSASSSCPVDHSSNKSTCHYDLWHDEHSPVGVNQTHAERHLMHDLGVTSKERHNEWGGSEIIFPTRNSPDTPFSPARITFQHTLGPVEATFDSDSLANRRSSSYHPPISAEPTSNQDGLSERRLSGHHPLGPAASRQLGLSEHSFHYSPRSPDFSQVDLPLHIFTAPLESSPKEPLLHDRSPAELDGQRVTRPIFSGNFGSELILPPNATAERAFSVSTTSFGIDPATYHDSTDPDHPATTLVERTFGLRHDKSITEIPTNSGLDHSIDLSGQSFSGEAETHAQNQDEDDISTEDENGLAYEDDEACCGKCNGFWWSEKDKYKTFWGERSRIEKEVQEEIERWRCHRCKQVRIRKKAVLIVEAELGGSMELLRTANEEDVHLREVEEGGEDTLTGEEDAKSKAGKRNTHIPGEWPES
ncbi:hypothetical protein E2P81_ATG00422 [Venturia nashicola]|nr:hypothetical protein E2P81_ATG00422 [Venturia nashicola]